MEKAKANLEIYEDDPFGSTCCGPGSRITSLVAVEKLRKRLEERSEITRRLSEEYKNSIIVKRDTINQKRWDCPKYVTKLMLDSKPTPYVFLNGEPIAIGKFPSYEEFTTLLKTHLKEQKQNQ